LAFTTRYQVFLSSTFTDLKEERAEVIQALWELDCIPTGMEAFLASNLSQWDIIKRVIDECDYYILIIGGRYGSLTAEGISYTEKEYGYAKSIGLPVLAFVHGAPEQIPVGKTEDAPDLRTKLDGFRRRVMRDHPVREWTTAHELGALASRSLVQEIKRNPRPGWVRNDGNSPVELLQRIDLLTQENLALKADVDAQGGPVVAIEELSSGSDEFKLNGTVRMWKPSESSWQGQRYRWSGDVAWDDMFRSVGPSLINEATEASIRTILGRYFAYTTKVNLEKWEYDDPRVNDATFAEILIQLRALGLIDKGTKKRGINDKAAYWQLTDFGDRYLVSLLAIRKNASKAAPVDNQEAEDDGEQDTESVSDLVG
jgi:hypothetical protein